MKLRSVAGILLLLAPYARGAAVNDDMRKRISDGISLSPIIGYDPTYRVLVGAAFFRGDTEPPVNNLDLFVYGTFKNVYGLEAKFTQWDRERMFFRFELEASNFYDAYFGEGNVNSPDDEVDIDVFKTVFNPSVWWRQDRNLSLGLYTELRYRNETGVEGDTTRRIFGNDFTPVFGIAFHYDTRDHQVLTREGQYYLARLDAGPGGLSTRAGAETFGRIELESRHFLKASESVVLAGQLALGTAFGEPGYQYRFNLGGSRKLRGYQSNRLRGRHYYLAQGELRFWPLNWLGLVGFTGVGDTADRNPGDFGRPKLTGGAGLRIGLPPDYVARARIDFGFSRDQFSFYLNFNEAL